MKLIQKTPLEVHRELLTSGIFERATQDLIAKTIGINQGTVSRIARGNFKRVNKSVMKLCKYAQISVVQAIGVKSLHTLVSSAQTVVDPEKRKLVDIINLAVDLLERP